jgi:hypothetical protein
MICTKVSSLEPTARAVAVAVVVLGLSTTAGADIMTFNSSSAGNNAATRTAWLEAIGIGAPAHLVDFESGFVNGENIHGVGGLFPLDMVINDTDAESAIMRTGSGVIGGSNPVGDFAVTQNERPFLELDFSANPVDYVAFQDIDQSGTSGVVTFVGGGTANISFETTSTGGNSAEFFGIFTNDQPPITLVQLDAAGDGRWGIDNIEYGSGGATTCIGDLDSSGSVGFNDLSILLGTWGPCGSCVPDIDGDGSVGFTDLVALLGAWGMCP